MHPSTKERRCARECLVLYVGALLAIAMFLASLKAYMSMYNPDKSPPLPSDAFRLPLEYVAAVHAALRVGAYTVIGFHCYDIPDGPLWTSAGNPLDVTLNIACHIGTPQPNGRRDDSFLSGSFLYPMVVSCDGDLWLIQDETPPRLHAHTCHNPHVRFDSCGFLGDDLQDRMDEPGIDFREECPSPVDITDAILVGLDVAHVDVSLLLRHAKGIVVDARSVPALRGSFTSLPLTEGAYSLLVPTMFDKNGDPLLSAPIPPSTAPPADTSYTVHDFPLMAVKMCMGLNNQRNGLYSGIALARRLRRRLVLPSLVTGFDYLRGDEGQTINGLEFARIYNNVQTMANLQGIVPFATPPPLSSQTAIVTGGDGFLYYSRTNQRWPLLRQNAKRDRTLALSDCLYRSVRLWNPPLTDLRKRIVLSFVFSAHLVHLASVLQKRTDMANGYNGLHFRGGMDMKQHCSGVLAQRKETVPYITDEERIQRCWISPRDILEFLSNDIQLSTEIPLYVATDPDVEAKLLPILQKVYRVVTKETVLRESRIGPFLPEERTGIDQIVLEGSRTFVGSVWSSFSSTVREVRGYRDVPSSASVYYNARDCTEFPCPLERFLYF